MARTVRPLQRYWADAEVQTLHPEEWPASASVWLFSVPWGLRKLLNWIDRRYGRPPIYVTENGWSTPGGEDVAAAVADSGRVAFYANYTSEMQRAINEDGVDVRGYFAWSLFDNFEWSCVAPSNGPAHAPGSHTSLSAGARLLGALRPSVHRLCDAATPAEGVGALVLRAHHGERRPRPGRLRWRGFMLPGARRRDRGAGRPARVGGSRCRHRHPRPGRAALVGHAA